MSCVTCHVSCVTCHVSRATCHVSQKKIKKWKNGKKGGATLSRVCYQPGLPRLVFEYFEYSEMNYGVSSKDVFINQVDKGKEISGHITCCRGSGDGVRMGGEEGGQAGAGGQGGAPRQVGLGGQKWGFVLME